jgi:hypothetical protein
MKNTLLRNREIDFVENILAPYHYQLDTTQIRPFFWKHIEQNDLRSPYAFSLILVTFWDYTVTIEGLNEPRLKRAIEAGLIEINSEEDVDALKELIFESEYDTLKKMEVVVPFFEQQLSVISQEPIHTDNYRRALANISLLVEAAAELE